MTQDEVDLIYNYLHENYKYEDGNLIHLKSISNKKAGDTYGSYQFIGKGLPKMKAPITINGKSKSYGLANIIYLFIYKEYYKYIKHIDKNPMNNSIENLKPYSLNEIKIDNSENSKGYKKVFESKSIKFRARVFSNGKYINIGAYEKEEDARNAYLFAKKIIVEDESINLKLLREKIKKKFPNSTLRVKNKWPKGVKERGEKFESYIYEKKDKKFNQKTIGYFDTPELAHQAYLMAIKNK